MPSSLQSCLGLQHENQSLLAFWKEVGSPQLRLCLGWRPAGPEEWEAGQWVGTRSRGFCYLLAWRAPLLPALPANICCSLAAPTINRSVFV